MSEASIKLRVLLNTLKTYRVKWWAPSSADMSGDVNDREVAPIDKSDVVSSERFVDRRHAVVLDIDHESWLVKSTTPGHYHLYIDVPGGIDWMKYGTMLLAMADAGVLEPGYVNASIERGHTAARLPWVKKPDPTPAAVEQTGIAASAQRVLDEAHRRGLLGATTGRIVPSPKPGSLELERRKLELQQKADEAKQQALAPDWFDSL